MPLNCVLETKVKKIIEFEEILDYTDCSRSILVKGMKILDHELVGEIGVISYSDERFELISWVSEETELWSREPYEVTVEKTVGDLENMRFGMICASCSCAEDSEMCAHIVAFMLKLQRIHDHEIFHLPDLKTWTKMRKAWKQLPQSQPLAHMDTDHTLTCNMYRLQTAQSQQLCASDDSFDEFVDNSASIIEPSYQSLIKSHLPSPGASSSPILEISPLLPRGLKRKHS